MKLIKAIKKAIFYFKWQQHSTGITYLIRWLLQKNVEMLVVIK